MKLSTSALIAAMPLLAASAAWVDMVTALSAALTPGAMDPPQTG